MQTSDRTRAALLAGEVVRGEFTPLGGAVSTPGTLTWSFDDGAELRLIGDTPGWPHEVGHFDLVIHALLEGRDELTLLSGGVTSGGGFGPVDVVRSATLVLGEHVDTTTRWARGIYGTTNLSEWVRDTGLRPHRPDKPGEPSGMLWKQPARHDFQLPRATAAIVGEADLGPVGLVPSWTVTTRRLLVVDVRRPATMDELHARYAVPLVSFTAFAADRPDSITCEVLRNPHAGQRAEVWRRGPRFEPRPWNSAHKYLFHARDLPRLTSALRRWWRLHDEVWPALELFAEHVTAGKSYSPARFLTLHSAMEAYCRARFGRKAFTLMHSYAAVSDDAHGCDKPALALLGLTREYLAHLNSPETRGRDEIINNVFETTRRANALMQACLLRELGFGHRQTASLLRAHHNNWPIPRYVRPPEM